MRDDPPDTGEELPADAVSASEFARNFGYYRVQAHRAAVAVSSHGRIAGYFIAPEEYEEYERLKSLRRTFATEALDDAMIAKVAESRMDPRHDHLNSLLEDE